MYSIRGFLVRFLDIYQVTQALATVLQNPKQMADMRRAWGQIDFESVRNQSALVCNCRHEDLVQLLEIDFVAVLERLATRSTEPVRDVIVWADECCDRLIGAGVAAARGGEDRSTLSSRSVLIRWGYVTSQIMRDLVSDRRDWVTKIAHPEMLSPDYSERPCIRGVPNTQAVLGVSRRWSMTSSHILTEF